MSIVMMTIMVVMVIVSSFLLQTNAGVVANEKVWNATAHADQGLKVVIDRNFDRYCTKKVQFRAVFWQFKMLKVSLSKALSPFPG